MAMTAVDAKDGTSTHDKGTDTDQKLVTRGEGGITEVTIS
jgi:hypothetical protein